MMRVSNIRYIGQVTEHCRRRGHRAFLRPETDLIQLACLPDIPLRPEFAVCHWHDPDDDPEKGEREIRKSRVETGLSHGSAFEIGLAEGGTKDGGRLFTHRPCAR